MKYVRISTHRIGSDNKPIIANTQIYTGSPLKGYKRKEPVVISRYDRELSWEQIQDMIKMKQYHVEILSTEDYFLEEI
jgi:hypothetical protein